MAPYDYRIDIIMTTYDYRNDIIINTSYLQSNVRVLCDKSEK